MPTPSPSAAVRVAECGSCGQLFAIHAVTGQVACPACAACAAIESLEIVELGIAAPVEVRVEPAPPEPEPVAPPQPVAQPTAAAEEAKPERPPTVAEWLLRGEQQDDPAAPAKAEPKRALSESLGWRSNEPPAEATAVADEATGPTEPEANPLADFRFDFGPTPLAEAAEDAPAENEPVSLELSSAAVAQPYELDPLTTKPKRRHRWASLTSVAAGLLAVAAPATYIAFYWDVDAPLVAENANRDRVLSVDEPEDTTAFAAEPTTVAPVEEDEPPLPMAAEAPIVDPSTRPASFNKGAFDEPTFDLPPSAATEMDPPPADEVGAPAETSTETPDDPFLATSPAPSMSAAPATAPSDRYASAAADPFVSPTPAEEPSAFDAPIDAMAPVDETALEPVSRTPAPPAVGLVNAPRYGAAELGDALAAGDESSRAFAAGTLADPEQVSAMGQHYARLCLLAQVVTLLDPDAAEPGLMTTELQAVDVFKRLFRGDRSRAESRQIAGPWIAWTGRPHGGVFFAGNPNEVTAAGDVVEYQFDIGGQSVPVVLSEPIDIDRFVNSGATEVGIVGVVVDNPRDRIAGYEGDSDRVVWARKTLPLPRPVDR